MKKAYEFAKYLVANNYDDFPNTFDGNMKLQKLLVFADLISLAKYDKPLFDDDIMAFKNGYVVESVRQKYAYDYFALKSDSDNFIPQFTSEESEILQYTTDIYGSLSAKKLSDLSHLFDFWSNSYDRSTNEYGYHDKAMSIISIESMLAEIAPIRKVIAVYEQNKNLNNSCQMINGIKFFYTPSEVIFSEDLINYLYAFSEDADESSYSVYYDNGELVVF